MGWGRRVRCVALLLAAAAWCAAGPGPPALRFARALYNVSVAENSPPRTYAEPPPGAEAAAVRLPAAGAHVRFRIRHGDRDKFFKAEERLVGDLCFLLVRTRAGHADVLNRERRDAYRLEVRATAQLPDGSQLEADTVVAVEVTDENDLSPLFYPTEYEALVPEDAPLHASIARVTAEDADIGINGEIYYSLAEPTDRFAVHPTSGVVTVTHALSAAEGRHELTVLARDRASLLWRGEDAPAARATLVVHVARVNLHAPELRVRHLPELIENSSAEIYAIVEVTDQDSGEHGRIASLEIVDGDPDGHFRVRPSTQAGEYDIVVHALLDRETAPRGYNLTLRASDAGHPQRSSYLTLPVTLIDANDNAPVFSREVYEANVPETAPPNTPVIRLKVSDRDEGRNARVYIEIVGGNEGGEFIVNPDTGVLYTAVPLDAEEKSLYTLTVSAIDQGNAGTRKQSSAKVKIAIVDANDNNPVFDKDDMEVTLLENGPTGVVVARVSAKDADSGENSYISYSVANLQPIPFEVDHFSGAVRTTHLLDYESMRREYVLRIRASDWGLPYRRQAEMRLTVRLEDVNDNRPQFERVDCVGYLPRRLAIGYEIVTLSAIDFDSGDVVSYRVIGGNEDNCFSLDSGTGVLSLSCDLADVRSETRVLNVTATDGTHFADPATLTLHLVGGGGGGDTSALECRDTGVARRLIELLAAAERSNAPIDFAEDFPLAPSRYGENLHVPEFVDFPVEIKVNESVALGTSLVRLRARDRDLGYNGLLVYAISGGDADSAFRIDPDTGELKVIGYLDREREDEYYLNITVYDLGVPQRSSSRLLPVTVLDVNDNPPKFEKTLASFRVTENAINGTAIFRANATDRDAGEFARVTYSLSGAGEGEFCVERDTGVLMVCAALDRERRALYELTVRATDGGGLRAEALVRVEVDDVNDNAPRFALAAYSARVREDVPVGSPVAVVEAFDPDLGAGGRLAYSLPDQAPHDAVFTVDATSGTVRTAKTLDYEQKQVYGVTVRATDGGRPSLWAEASLVVEVGDVDENRHAPVFAERGALALAVAEDAPVGSLVGVLRASDADPPGRDSRLAYYALDGSGMAHFSVDDTGTVRTLTPLDRETTPHYWLTVCAEDHALVPRFSCIQVYVEVEDVNDMAPWPERAAYAAAVAEHCAANTRVAVVRAHDADAAPRPPALRYALVAGNPDGLFAIGERSGEIVTTGRALDREAAPAHALEVSVTDGELASAVRVRVTLLDLNDHAPAFTQRFYDLRVPLPPPDDDVTTEGAESSAEGEGEAEGEADSEAEEEDESLGWDEWDEPRPSGIYVATVMALDSDEGANGTVRYAARGRGAARGLLRVHARSGRIYASRSLPLRGRAYDLTVRACDGGRRARCALARARVRGAAAGGGRAPSLAAPAPLQAAELDAPGFLLALLAASDPDGDQLYYDIVDGDPEHDFVVGREDGSLVVARRLLWERAPHYRLNVSASDGRRTAYAAVNITVINDSNEGGVEFEREEYTVDVSESARAGDSLLVLRAAVRGKGGGGGEGGEPQRLLYGLHATRAPADASLFRLHELTGVLELARPLDRWGERGAARADGVGARPGAARVAGVRARHAARARRRRARARLAAPPRGGAAGARRGGRHAGGAAARLRPRRAARRARYSLAADGGGLFAVDALGDVRLARALPPQGPRDYTLLVRAQGPPPAERAATLPLHVVLVEADGAPPRFARERLECEVFENEPAGTVLAALEARSGSAVWYSLSGGQGLFRLNPAAGVLSLAAPLDFEACALYNLTVTAVNMGGGSSEAHVWVHVLDRNEFAPQLRARSFLGRASEAAAPGALVLRRADDEPLVLLADDADSPANRQRAFELLEPSAAALFRVDATTGALSLAAPLDYERATFHEFTVKVVDMGEPRLPSDSVATVRVEVTNVNDCPPQFSHASYEATVLLPTAAGVRVLRLEAADADGDALAFDVLEDESDGAFELSAGGELLVSERGAGEALRPEQRLRVRVSDGRYSATARVLVRARRPDNAGLAFHKTDYYGSVLENTTKPATVAVLNVLGAALNEHVEFSILNPTAGFRIGATSGAVRSGGVALDRERRASYTLLVRAAAGPRVAHARLHVAVSDVNDNCPEFAGQPYAAALPAGSPPGAHVLRVHASDADANDNGEVRYEMKRGNGELFRVDRKTGQITLKQTLEAHNQLYTLVVAAFDGGTPACGAEAAVSVRAWGGGAAPLWPRAHFALEAREDAPAGRALEPPLGALSPLGRPLIYTLQEGAGLFEVHFDSGAVVPRGALDYEAAREHRLVVRATDGVSGAFADVFVTVHVLDVNDCAPEFERDEFRADVSEAAPPGELVLTVRATDRDSGANGNVTYSLSRWGPAGWGAGEAEPPPFSVSEAGEVRVAAPLDREARALHHLLVTASDGGRPPRRSSAHLLLAVRDVNDNAPRLERAVLTALVSEEAARGTVLARVAAWDPDAADAARLRFALEGGAEQRRAFALDAASGLLVLAEPRALAAAPRRSLNVSVSDGARAAFARLKLALAPANRRAPHFPHLVHEARAPENQPPPLLLTTVKAHDEDSGEFGAVTYSIPSARLRDTFAVDARSGAFTARVALDREARAEWRVFFRMMLILITKGCAGVIAEDEGSPGAAVMAITRVHVLDVNEHAPSFHSQPYVVHLAENTPPNSNIIQLMADDPDAGSNGEVRFSLGEAAEGEAGEAGEAEAGEGPAFAVEAHSGWVRTLRALDREARAEYRVPLLATDGGTPRRAARGTLVVRLVDYNDCPPVFERAQYEAAVREDAAAGTVAARLAVADADAAGAPLAFFVAGGDAAARFQLRAAADAAELYVARALDREEVPRYELTVAATDGKFTAFARVLLTVLDVNDNPPCCTQHRVRARLSEHAPRGAHVAAIAVRDADEPHNARLRFYLSGEHAHHFAVDKESGVITVAEELDRESVAEYTLVAHAQDRDRPEWECSTELEVTLDDVNDNAPRFSAEVYSVTLPEDADIGSLVAKVHATDADLGENRLVRYSFVEEGNEAFELAADSGIVTLRAALDRETQAEHRLLVRASDAGAPPLSATATVRLTVADVNDNPPEFEFKQYRASAPELDAVGTELLRVRATSRDAGVNADVFYSLVAGDDREDFAVDRASGALTIARPLDYERRREYFLTVQAIDGGTPPLSDHATVNVTVLDGNDNAPVFAQSSYGARVREDAAPGTRVLQLIADDADAGANGRVTYAIARGDRDGRFAVDADTGYVSVAAPLDREATPAYVLELRATDRGQPPLEASAFLNIEVLDANDNAPLFAHSNYSAVVQEDKPLGHTILKFVVDDADAPPNAAPFTFDFQSGNEMGAFRLEQDGYLRSATRFNHRIKDRYVLQVRVFDNGTPPLFSDAWVYIKVIEESHHPPVVTPLEIVINSYQDEFPGGVIGRVFASDRDAYDTLSYALAPVDGAPYPSTDLFEIDAAVGTLRAAPRIDVGEYRLNVTVDDGKFLGFAVVHVAVVLVTDEMLAQAIVVRFREVTDRDFVLSHRKGFVRAVHEAVRCRQADVVIVGVQPSDADLEGEAGRARRTARQVAQDLDVAFAVRSADGEGFLSADALRRGLHAHLERLEESARLVVEELVRAACPGCVHGACAERVQLLEGGVRAVATDVFALVAAPHRLRAECACAAGFDGARCERPAAACAQCGAARCEPWPAPPGYRCCAPPEAEGEQCRAPAAVAFLPGDGYLAYRVDGGVRDGARLLADELTLSLRFRTRRERGVLAFAAGRVDYAVLEVAEGRLRFRMELGAGELAVSAGGAVADGEWHEARLERRGAAVRLSVDGRGASAQAPPASAVLDAAGDRLLVGAALLRHAFALAPEQVTYGFHGCISDLKIGNSALPLEEGGSSADGRVQLARRVRARVAPSCPALPPPAPCDSYPCLHGGSCRPLPEGGFACACHARFAGRLCERDTDPCASQPCLHGGLCSPAPGGAFRCACAAGLTGARCERGRWCGAGACQHGGACEEGERGPSCRCHGYYGPRCEYDVDECAGEPCLNGATCRNEPGSFRCVCPPDKTGMNCGNPLYSHAVVAGEAAGPERAVRLAWRWALEARWPLGVAAAVALLLLLACGAPLAARRRAARSRARAALSAPLNSALEKAPPPRASKLSNLEAVRRERPASCAEPPPLNNIDTLRSYGSAGDELEGIPPDYLRNLNIDVSDRKPWSEQMHLQTFVDNKIYNDLKGCKRQPRPPPEPHMLGGYHWDCSDWCGGGGALPGISEVAGSERPDSSSPPSAAEPSPLPKRPRAPRRARPPHHSPAAPLAPLAPPTPLAPLAPLTPPTPLGDSDSAPDDLDALRFTDASSYLLHPDEYLPVAGDGGGEGDGEGEEGEGEGEGALRGRGLREPDAASLITMLAEERHSLLGGADSCSDISAHLCEIEDSEAEGEPGAGQGRGAERGQWAKGAPRHTDV
ncbi:unnamed protein product, partial [Iphiclides podalirius]